MHVIQRLQQGLLPEQGTAGTEFLGDLFDAFSDLFPAMQDQNWLAWVRMKPRYLGEIQGILSDQKSSDTLRARLLVAVNLPLEWSVVPWQGYRDLAVNPKEPLCWTLPPRLKDFMLQFIIAVISELHARPRQFAWNYDPLFVFNRRILGFLTILNDAEIETIMSYFSLEERELHSLYDIYQPFWLMMAHQNVPEKYKRAADQKMRNYFEKIRKQIRHSQQGIDYCHMVFQRVCQPAYSRELWQDQLGFILGFPYSRTLVSLHYLCETLKNLITVDSALCLRLVRWAVLSPEFEWHRRTLFLTPPSEIIQLHVLLEILYPFDRELAGAMNVFVTEAKQRIEQQNQEWLQNRQSAAAQDKEEKQLLTALSAA